MTVRGVGKTVSENAIRLMFGLISAGIIGVVALLLAMRADLSVLKRDNDQNRADVVEIKAKLDAVTSSQYPREDARQLEAEVRANRDAVVRLETILEERLPRGGTR